MNTEEKRDYYVYLHKRKDDGVVFYVGSGRGNRLNSKHNRNKDWQSIVSLAGGHEVIKLHTNLSQSESLDIEDGYIKTPKDEWELVNKRLPRRVHKLNQMLLHNYFYYDPTSPSSLRYSKSTYNNTVPGSFGHSKDDIAGTMQSGNSKTYWRLKVTLDGIPQRMLVHRIVWIITNGVIPEHLVIDHIDGDSLNNNIENLRLVSQSTNVKNKRITRIGESGVVGISTYKGHFKVSMSLISGKLVSKSFSINKYGEEKAMYLAAKYRYDFLTQTKDGSEYSHEHSGISDLLKIITDFESQGEYFGISSTGLRLPN